MSNRCLFGLFRDLLRGGRPVCRESLSPLPPPPGWTPSVGNSFRRRHRRRRHRRHRRRRHRRRRLRFHVHGPLQFFGQRSRRGSALAASTLRLVGVARDEIPLVCAHSRAMSSNSCSSRSTRAALSSLRSRIDDDQVAAPRRPCSTSMRSPPVPALRKAVAVQEHLRSIRPTHLHGPWPAGRAPVFFFWLASPSFFSAPSLP